jgi:uncharacterized protein YhdP
VVDSFELNTKRLGKLEISASLGPGAGSGASDWRLTRLALTAPEARFTGTGRWSDAPRRRMALDFNLDLSDSGAFLERLGMGRVLKGGKGSSRAGDVDGLAARARLPEPRRAARGRARPGPVPQGSAGAGACWAC